MRTEGAAVLAEHVYDRVREREREDPEAVGPVLELLADPSRGSAVTLAMRQLAGELAEQRHGAAVAAFSRQALTTAQVLERVSTWTSRKTVAAARQRGQLLGLTIGRQTFHPDWQFTANGVRDGVEEVVEPLLTAAAGDVVLADQIMREPRSALDGRTLGQLLAAGRSSEVVAALTRYRDGFDG